MQLLVGRPLHPAFGGGRLIDQIEQTIRRNQFRVCGERLLHVRIDVLFQRVRFGFEHEQITQISDQISHQSHHVFPAFALLMQQIDRPRCFSSQYSSCKIDHGLFAGESEHVKHIALADFLSAKRDQLIEHRFRIAQAAFRSARDRVRCRRLQRNLLFSGDELQMLRDQVCRDPVEIESLTAAQNCWQNSLRLGRCENKFHVLGRLFQRLQKRIKRRLREHVHFVDQVNFVATLCRGIAHIVA